ncbi:MAG: TlpA family protein disulfide reductase [Burkholderiales bacterium]|nr:TlpA family protein disulfide reductase [Burkholderiales bacterium]
MIAGRREALVLGAAGIAAAAAGFLIGPLFLGAGRGREEALPGAASFPDLQGKPRQLSEWRGKVLVCNFWATWCTPCREEIPMLIGLREKYLPNGLEIVGIAIDQADKVRDFASSFNISYPVLLAEAGGIDLMRGLGNQNGGLPYTVIADRSGGIAHRKLGLLKQADLEPKIRSLLQA